MVASRWLEDFEQAIEIKHTVILCGNVKDKYLYSPRITGIADAGLKELLLLDMRSLLKAVMGDRWNALYFYDMVEKENVLRQSLGSAAITSETEPSGSMPDVDLSESRNEDPGRGFGINSPPDRDMMNILRRLTEEDGIAYVIDFADKLAPEGGNAETETRVAICLAKAIENIKPENRLILLYRFREQIPREFKEDYPFAKVIELPPPDRKELEELFRSYYGLDEATSEKARDASDGMKLYEIEQIAGQPKNNFDIDEFERRVRQYKYGRQDNPWSEIKLDKLNRAFHFFQEELKGQDEAIEKMVEIIVRARADILRKTGGNPRTPRGKLFFAGPTGVGKTLAAKKLAEFLFGSKDNILRFDMSEYAQEFQVSRLYGAPPGYIGYEKGGTLTNAIKKKPFSVVLFDEIEKAHSGVFDIFLQILEDGRLTDSMGETVYFSETIIIFTSNLGTRSRDINNVEIQERDDLERLRKGGDANAVNNHFSKSVINFFMSEISRPELLNRIGLENIIVFNYIETEDIIKEMFRQYLNETVKSFNESFRNARPQLALALPIEELTDMLYMLNKEKIKLFGGRFVENVVNGAVRDKLALHVLQAEYQEMQEATIRVSVNDEEIRFELV
jgi:ATP-dependent Clp protease ATP-binding subunit ClpA